MLRKSLFPLFVAAVVGLGAAAEFWPAAPAGAGDASTGASTTVAKAAAKKSLTAKAVKAAKAFKGSLSSSQRSTL